MNATLKVLRMLYKCVSFKTVHCLQKRLDGSLERRVRSTLYA
ncbi:MAG: hypothetical protein JWQ21_4158 [Herminiimonas sp.]|nr:hypothetical protein [Herminiimonas sp.]